jgi:hypothetical protein
MEEAEKFIKNPNMTQFLSPLLPHLGEKYFRRGKKIPKGFYRITVKAMIQDDE